MGVWKNWAIAGWPCVGIRGRVAFLKVLAGGRYSYRKATMGSTMEALRAGR
jgi:hypothetical protein